jgi:hypothetical protein
VHILPECILYLAVLGRAVYDPRGSKRLFQYKRICVAERRGEVPVRQGLVRFRFKSGMLFRTAALAALASLLVSSSAACRCIFTPYPTQFQASASVVKVRVEKEFFGNNGASVGDQSATAARRDERKHYYRVRLLKEYKACGSRPRSFVVEDGLFGTSCQAFLQVGSTMLLQLGGERIPGLSPCVGNQGFEGLDSATAQYLLENDQCRAC